MKLTFESSGSSHDRRGRPSPHRRGNTHEGEPCSFRKCAPGRRSGRGLGGAVAVLDPSFTATEGDLDMADPLEGPLKDFATRIIETLRQPANAALALAATYIALRL